MLSLLYIAFLLPGAYCGIFVFLNIQVKKDFDGLKEACVLHLFFGERENGYDEHLKTF